MKVANAQIPASEWLRVQKHINRHYRRQISLVTFSDPPYNVNYGATSKETPRGKKQKIANDDLGQDFEQFLRDACVNIVAVTREQCAERRE